MTLTWDIEDLAVSSKPDCFNHVHNGGRHIKNALSHLPPLSCSSFQVDG